MNLRFASILACLLLPAAISAQPSATFQIQSSPSPNAQGNALSAVTAFSPADIWAVGYQAENSSYNNGARTLIEHFDGSVWSVVPSPNPNPGRCSSAGFALTGVAASSSSDAWAVGTRNVNSTCTSLINPLIVHWDGTSWKTAASPTLSPNGNNELLGVMAFATNNAYAVGYQTGPRDATFTLVEHWDGSAWSVIKTPNANNTGNYLTSVSATSPTDIWTVGDKVAPNVPIRTMTMHFDGSQWSLVPSPSPVQNTTFDQNVLLAVSAVAPNDVTAVGYSLNSGALTNLTLIEHWNGSAWQVVPSPNVSTAQGSGNVLTSIAAISSSNIYAFGYYSDAATGGQPQTLVEHFDGNSWTILPSPTRKLATQLFGAAALPTSNSIWSVGAFSPNGIDQEFGFLQVPQTFVMFSTNP